MGNLDERERDKQNNSSKEQKKSRFTDRFINNEENIKTSNHNNHNKNKKADFRGPTIQNNINTFNVNFNIQQGHQNSYTNNNYNKKKNVESHNTVDYKPENDFTTIHHKFGSIKIEQDYHADKSLKG